MKFNTLNKIFTLLLAAGSIVPLFAFTTPVAEWLRQSIDQRFSIEFPSKPKEGSGYGTTGYNSILPEASYLATAIHYNKQSHVKPITEPYSYYVRMLNSQIMGTRGTLVDSTSFTLDGFQGLQFSFTAIPPKGIKQITRTKRVIFVDGWVYQAEHMFLSPVTKASQEKMQKFFDSMRLTHM